MNPPPRNNSAPTLGRPTSQASGQSVPKKRAGYAARFNLGKAFAAESFNFYFLTGVTLFLVLIGLIMVLSASAVDSFLEHGGFFVGFGKQALAVLVAIPVMLMISRLPTVFYKKWANIALYSSIGLQLLVFTPLGVESGGNRNWLDLGFVFQPSEIIKLTIAVWMGVNLPIIIGRLGADNWRILLALTPVYIALGSVLFGQDLGTAIILFSIVLGGLVFSGVGAGIIAIPVVAGALGILGFAITSPNRMSRIMSFLNDNCVDYTNACWQPLHGKWALANGGIFGVGLGQSKAKWSWLPAADNDYIFAIIGEELGLIGALVVIGMFVAMTVAFLRIIRSSQDLLVRTTTGAIMVWIVGQAFVNIGVVIGVLPVLGVPLPLLSSGSTALVMSLLAIGVVLSFTTQEQPIRTPRSRKK